jgi:hypothetical protein
MALYFSVNVEFAYYIFFDRKTIISFYRYSYYLAKTTHYHNTLKISISLFALIIAFDFFLGGF